jgi:AraC family transcriptional regulator
MGSPTFRAVELPGFRVTDATFPPLTRLPKHIHERTVVAVPIEGSFDVMFDRHRHAVQPGTVLTEPATERHGNAFVKTGARVLVIEPAPETHEILAPCHALLDRAGAFPAGPVGGIARRLLQEVDADDPYARVAMEGLVFELLAAAARQFAARSDDRRPPTWLRTARELIHSEFRRNVRVSYVAHVVGVHPMRLTRAFRTFYGTSPGSYVRRLRLEWSLEQLACSEEPLNRVALQAGYADQSHLTRAVKRSTGHTPAEYRSAQRGRRLRRT